MNPVERELLLTIAQLQVNILRETIAGREVPQQANDNLRAIEGLIAQVKAFQDEGIAEAKVMQQFWDLFGGGPNKKP